MTKVYRDERMLDMLNIIFENVSYDMGYMYDWGGIGSLTPVMLLNKQSDLSSRYAAIKEVISSEIRLAIDDYASIN